MLRTEVRQHEVLNDNIVIGHLSLACQLTCPTLPPVKLDGRRAQGSQGRHLSLLGYYHKQIILASQFM